MPDTSLLEWLLSKPAPQIALLLTLVGSVVFLLYGIFAGRPPFFKEASIDLQGRRWCLALGVSLLIAFSLILLLPTIYDAVQARDLVLHVDGQRAPESTTVAAFDEQGRKLPGLVSLAPDGEGHAAEEIVLPEMRSDLVLVRKPLRMLGVQNQETADILNSRDKRLYVGNEFGGVGGPVQLVDANQEVVFSFDVHDDVNMIRPDRGRVEFYNTVVWMTKGQQADSVSVAALQFDLFDYGESAELFRRFEHFKKLDTYLIASSDSGKVMANGALYDSTEMVAASGLFPLGTVLELRNPFRGDITVTVTVTDSSSLFQVSESVVDRFSLPARAGHWDMQVRVVDFIKKERRADPPAGG